MIYILWFVALICALLQIAHAIQESQRIEEDPVAAIAQLREDFLRFFPPAPIHVIDKLKDVYLNNQTAWKLEPGLPPLERLRRIATSDIATWDTYEIAKAWKDGWIELGQGPDICKTKPCTDIANFYEYIQRRLEKKIASTTAVSFLEATLDNFYLMLFEKGPIHQVDSDWEWRKSTPEILPSFDNMWTERERLETLFQIAESVSRRIPSAIHCQIYLAWRKAMEKHKLVESCGYSEWHFLRYIMERLQKTIEETPLFAAVESDLVNEYILLFSVKVAEDAVAKENN